MLYTDDNISVLMTVAMSDDQKTSAAGTANQQEQHTSGIAAADETRATAADITHATLNPAQPALYSSQPQEGTQNYNNRGELPPVEVENYFNSIERSSQPAGVAMPQALMGFDDPSSIVTLAGNQPSSFYTKTTPYANTADIYKSSSMFASTTTPLLSHAYSRLSVYSQSNKILPSIVVFNVFFVCVG